jgi:hypothetical protein
VANKKISDLPPSSPDPLDELPAARTGTNVKLLVGDVVDLAQVYTNPAYPDIQTVGEALDQLLYTPLSVTSFTNNVGTVEIGSTVNTVTLSWGYNKAAVVSQSLAPTPGSLPVGDRSASLAALGLTSDTTFTITGNDGTQSASRTTQVLFRNKVFWGVSATATPPGGAFIDTLGNSAFSTSRNQTRTFSASSQYLYFAWPSGFGEPTFKVNGFPVSGWVKTIVTYTNSQGYASTFWIYRSEYLQNGASITVEVT